jgi:hypothetical protein
MDQDQFIQWKLRFESERKYQEKLKKWSPKRVQWETIFHIVWLSELIAFKDNSDFPRCWIHQQTKLFEAVQSRHKKLSMNGFWSSQTNCPKSAFPLVEDRIASRPFRPFIRRPRGFMLPRSMGDFLNEDGKVEIFWIANRQLLGLAIESYLLVQHSKSVAFHSFTKPFVDMS